VTFTLTPALMSWRIAGIPAGVAGTLIITFSRATAPQSRRAARSRAIRATTSPTSASVGAR